MLGRESLPRLGDLSDEDVERGGAAGSGEGRVVVGPVDGEAQVGPGSPELYVGAPLELTQAVGLLERGLPVLLGPLGPCRAFGLACGFRGLSGCLVPLPLSGGAARAWRDLWEAGATL